MGAAYLGKCLDPVLENIWKCTDMLWKNQDKDMHEVTVFANRRALRINLPVLENYRLLRRLFWNFYRNFNHCSGWNFC